ncbi:MAG TPA: hypothetical protein VGK81_11400, partial [Anaerolineae bacterium]
MTAQHFRFSGLAQAMKAEIDTGSLGDVYHACSWMLRRGFLPVRPTFIYSNIVAEDHASISEYTFWI